MFEYLKNIFTNNKEAYIFKKENIVEKSHFYLVLIKIPAWRQEQAYQWATFYHTGHEIHDLVQDLQYLFKNRLMFVLVGDQTEDRTFNASSLMKQFNENNIECMNEWECINVIRSKKEAKQLLLDIEAVTEQLKKEEQDNG